MKQYLFFLLALTSILLAHAQTPGIPYQATLLAPETQLPGANSGLIPLKNTDVCLRFTFKSASGTEYQETQTATTGEFGRIDLVIGNGTPLTGSFAGINWDGNPKTMEVDIDYKGLCANFEPLALNEFQYVPYAFFALNAGSGSTTPPTITATANPTIPGGLTIGTNNLLINVDDADSDPNNEIQNLEGVLTQNNNAGGLAITNLLDPTNAQDAATKAYVDAIDIQLVNNSDGTFTFTDKSGTETTFDTKISTVLDNTDGTYTITDDSGTSVTIDTNETSSTLVDNADGTFTYTNEAGVATSFDAKISTVLDNTDGTYTITDDSGTSVTIDTNETSSTLIDNADGTFTYTNEAGVATSFDAKISTVLDNTDGTYTITDDSGTSVTIDTNETSSTLVDNADGTFTYTNEAGVATSFDAKISTVLDNTDGTYTISDDFGTSITIDANLNTKLSLTGGTMTGDIEMSSNDITNANTISATSFIGDLSGSINSSTTATTQAASDNSTKIATTQYADQAASTASSGKLDLTGGTMTGDIEMGSNDITNANTISATSFIGDLSGSINSSTTATTQASDDNSTKIATTQYADRAASTASSGKLDLTGGTMTGDIEMSSNDITNANTISATSFIGDLSGSINSSTTAFTQAASDNSTKIATTQYADRAASTASSGKLDLTGGTMTGDIEMSNNNITNANTISATSIVGELSGSITSSTTATTQAADDNSTKIATTQYADRKLSLTGGTMTGDIEMSNNNITNANTISATSIVGDLSGSINSSTTAFTQAASDNSTKIATTQYADRAASTASSGKLDLTGGTMTGDIEMSNNNITNANTISATSIVGELSGSITSSTTATTQAADDNSTKIATTQYADRKLSLTGGTMTGDIEMNNFQITNVSNITSEIVSSTNIYGNLSQINNKDSSRKALGIESNTVTISTATTTVTTVLEMTENSVITITPRNNLAYPGGVYYYWIERIAGDPNNFLIKLNVSPSPNVLTFNWILIQ